MRMTSRFGRACARFLSPMALSIAGLLIVASPALAAKTALTPEQKEKVRKAIDILEGGLKEAGIKDMKMKDVLGSGAGQMPYEQIPKDGMMVDPTFCDAIDHMKNMLDKDNIVTDPDLSAFGTVNVQPGIDSDKIVINKALLDKICDMTASAVDRAKCKVQLISTLANELTHVFQPWTTATDAERCDGEHDSDCASIKILEALCKILEKDGMPGTPNDSLAGILGDADYFPGLIACLFDLGIDTAAEIKDVYDHVKARLGKDVPADMRTGYKGRKADFAGKITAGTSWTAWYGGGRDDPILNHPNNDAIMRTGARLVARDLVTSQFYSLPPPFLLTTSLTLSDDTFNMLFAMTASNGAGQRFIFLLRDNTGDELPEISSTIQIPFPPAIPGLPDLYDTQMKSGIPIEMHPLGLRSGVLILDRFEGSFWMLPLTGSGGFVMSPQLIFQDPLLMSGNFDVFEQFTHPDPGRVRFIFRQANDGEPSVIWFDVNLFDLSVNPSLGPGQTMAMAKAPLAGPGVTSLFISAPFVELTGNPGEQVAMFSVGRDPGGFPIFIAQGSVSDSGRTPPANAFAPILGNDLYMVPPGGFPTLASDDERGGGPGAPPVFHYLPRRGVNIDCRVVDDHDLPDGVDDRIHVSVHPNRIHFLQGMDPGFPTFVHDVEIAIDCGGLAGFVDWSPADGYVLFGGDEMFPFHRIPFQNPPPYSTPLDIDGDGMADEAVVLARFPGDTAFFTYVFFDIFGLPFVQSGFALPMSLEPDCIEYLDLNGDTMVDVRLSDFDGGPDVCLLNSFPPPGPLAIGDPRRGGGGFVIGPCVVVPPCCLGNANKTPGIVNFGQVLTVLANFGSPANPNGTSVGDANCDGFINFLDVLVVLANFGDICA